MYNEELTDMLQDVVDKMRKEPSEASSLAVEVRICQLYLLVVDEWKEEYL